MNMNRKSRCSIFCILLLLPGVAPVWSQFHPPAGAEDTPLYLSPFILGRGGSVTSLDSPRADAINPAASGSAQRAVLDAAYTGITGFGAEGQGWDGHGASLAATFPSRYGVFSGGLNFLSATLDDYNLGTNAGLKFSYARDIWDDVDVGAGVNLDFGGAGDRLATGATLDLGMMYRPRELFGISDGRLGVALRGIGYGYRPFEDRSSVPSTFTPHVGVALPLISEEAISLEVSGDLSAPSFQDGRLQLGTTISFFDRVDISTGWGVSAREVLESDRKRSSLLPSVGISVNFGADLRGRTDSDSLIARQGWDQSEVRTRLAARPLYGNAWALGGGVNIPLGVIDTTPPDVHIDYPNVRYVGPNNSGVNDDITLPITIHEQRRLVGYELRFETEDEEVVRRIENRSEPPTERNVRTFFQQLTRVDRGIDVPQSIRWNGRSDSGSVVADGEYYFVLEAWDDNGNRGASERHRVVIDTTPPRATVTTPFGAQRAFSPNDDGTRDVFPISQSGTLEDEWQGRIVNNEGQAVRTLQWSNSQPEPFEWDGLNDSGEFVQDGVYHYELASTDRAGNAFSTRLGNIILDTEPTPLGIAIDRRYLAPTGNGINDTILLTPDVPVRRNIVEWSMSIRDTQDREVIAMRGGPEGPPERYEFRGRGRDGNVIPEAEYEARLRVRYRNGNEPIARSARFTVDLTPPQASVSGEVSVFAPTGDGNRDTMVLYHEASGGDRWIGRILDGNGTEVARREWSRSVPARWEWDGRRANGSLAPDGEYRYVLEGTDAAGNSTTSNEVAFRINTEDTDVLVTSEYDAFSPNGNGTRDTIGIFPQLNATGGIEEYRLTILDATGQVIRSFSGTTVPDRLTWDGIDRNGRRALDGSYRARLAVDYETGVTSEATTTAFLLDTVPPQATVEVPQRLFSPDDSDGRQQIAIQQVGGGAESWRGTIRNAEGQVVYTREWDEAIESFSWNGRDDAGNRVSDGIYSYELTGSDMAGNTTRIAISDITVDTRPTRVFATVDGAGFSPTGTGSFEDIGLELLVSPADGADKWSVAILSSDGQSVRTFDGDDVQSERELRWDGKNDSGELVDAGVYRAEFSVEFAKGNRPVTRSSSFQVVTEAPRVRVELDHEPFTPDGISGPEELEFRIEVDTIADIAEWDLEILDRNNRFFNEFFGTGRPASVIRWDGRASDGERVISAEDYPWIMRAVDVYGNETVVEGSVPVGILLVRDGDRYKVQIPSITFEPNSPVLVVDPDDPRGVQNNAVLNRLVEIFDRYQQYSIVIEGHAVNLTGTEREERDILEPLSRGRAQSVREALVDRGMSQSRVDVVGRGGLDPLVPHDNLDERWRNRRVDFILER